MYGDRIRGAPAVVNAGRSKHREQACTSTDAGCGGGSSTQSGTSVDGGRKHSRRNGAPPEIDHRKVVDDDNSGGGPTRGNGDLATVNGGDLGATKDESTAISRSHADGGDGGGGGGDGGSSLNRSGTTVSTASTSPGLYRPRTSGRGVGGSLRRRFSDDQVALSAGYAAVRVGR